MQTYHLRLDNNTKTKKPEPNYLELAKDSKKMDPVLVMNKNKSKLIHKPNHVRVSKLNRETKDIEPKKKIQKILCSDFENESAWAKYMQDRESTKDNTFVTSSHQI